MSIEAQLKHLLDSITTGPGMLGVSFFVLLLAASLMMRSVKWAVLAGMLFVSTLSFTVNEIDTVRRLIFPLDSLRYQGRGATMALMFLALIGLLLAPRGWRRRYVLMGTGLFFVFQVMMAARLTVSGDAGRGLLSILIFVIMFVTLALALSHALQQWGDAVTLVRAVAGYGVIFTVLNLIQLLVSPAVVEQNGRFYGTTGNPQHAGAILASVLLPMAYLMTRPGRSRLSRLLLGAVMSITVVFLLWTGSRTALLMGVVGLGILFRARLGRLAIGGIVVGGLVLLAISVLFPDKEVVSSRLVSTLDTRSNVWTELIYDFLKNPIFGRLHEGQLDLRENSYLSILGRLGLVGALPFFAAIFLMGRNLLHLRRVRRQFEDPMMADLVTAGLIQIAVGGMFEGYLAGTLSPQVLVLYCYLAMLSFLLEVADTVPVDHGLEYVPDEFTEYVDADETLPASTW